MGEATISTPPSFAAVPWSTPSYDETLTGVGEKESRVGRESLCSAAGSKRGFVNFRS